jgi:hypothetical protein
MIEKMHQKAEAEVADIVVCDFLIEKQNNIEYRCDFVPNNKKDYFNSILLEKSGCSLFNKLVHKNLYKLPDCRSVEGLNCAEDMQVTTRLYYYAEKIAKIDCAFYHYNKTNINSITASKTSMHYENAMFFFNLLEKFLIENKLHEKYFDFIEYSKVFSKANLFLKTKDYKLRRKYTNIYRDIEMKYIKYLTFKGEKIIIFLNHYRLYFLAHLVVRLIQWKNRNNK